METDDVSHASVSGEASSAVSASRLSRLFFILGQVAIQHLVFCVLSLMCAWSDMLYHTA